MTHIFEGFEPFCLCLRNVGSGAGEFGKATDMTVASGLVFGKVAAYNVAETHALTRHFVGVCRANAFTCGADFRIALGFFEGGVEQTVRGEDKVNFLRYFQYLLDVDARSLERAGFFFEKHRVEHHATAYYINGIVLENAGRNGTQHIFFAVEFEGMAGIRPSLETGHDIVGRSEHVHYLAFAFVAPLETQEHICFHLIDLRK